MKSRSGHLIAATIIGIVAIGSADIARAQFGNAIPGLYQLPNNDFTWLWGADTEDDLRGPSDFRSRGRESGFECELTANLSPSNRLTQNEIRQIESQLSTSLAFIQEAAYLLADWDYNRQIFWGRLACVKLEPQRDAEAEQEKIDRALERAIRDRERRRARQEDD